VLEALELFFYQAREEPRLFPEYGPSCHVTCWLDLHGFMLEVVCHEPEDG
jgi:hypothetical protein